MLTLNGSGGSLLIELAVNDLGWSRCYLLGEKRVYLGAEGADRLLVRLQDSVQDELEDWPPLGETCGYSVRCALLLSEAHHSLYFASAGFDRILLWQDANLGLVGTIRLSPEQRRRWQDQLTDAVQAYSLNHARQAAITKEIAEIVGGAEALK